MNLSIRLLIASTLGCSLSFAVQTRTWSQDGYSEFEKGEVKGVSLSSNGLVRLAPAFREVFDSSSVYLWALAEDSKGNLYAGGGGPGGPGARIYVIPPKGKGKTVAELDALEVHALAIDAKDQVYAATSPDGKVYRVSGAKAELFYDPRAKYVWGMAFNSKGDLFIATGDHGEIHKVAPSGKGDIFFKTGETHARSLAVDERDNLVVGTEPGGLIIRISPEGLGFVLYQAPKGEITSVAVGKDGTIYAAAVGAAKPSTPGYQALTPPLPPQSPTGPAGSPPSPQGRLTTTSPSGPVPTLRATSLPSGGSELYRIDKDGSPRKIWSSTEDIAYTIGFDVDARPLIGTGNRGIIYRVDSGHVYTELLNAPPTQVTCIYAAPSGRVYAATGNVGKVYQIGPGTEKEGSLESDVFDAGMFSYWGRLRFRGDLNGGEIAVQTRSGNVDRPLQDWSPWSPAITSAEGTRIASPPARFLQWKAVLRSAPSGQSPDLREVEAAYLTKNVAPIVNAIEITPPNYRFSAPSATLGSTYGGASQTLSLPPIGDESRNSSTSPATTESSSSSMQKEKGSIGARWATTDDNSDTLSYTIHVKGEKETDWKLLKDKVKGKQFSWDSTAFPDGEYRIRVVATDSPTNAPERALTGQLTSEPFLIDNTPPRVTDLAAVAASDTVTVTWKGQDALSLIRKAEYSVNGGEWTIVDPTTNLSDSRTLEYRLSIPRPSPGEMTIAVRVTDEYDNQAVDKAIVR